MPDFILYTSHPGASPPQYRAFGPTDKDTARAAGERFQAETPAVGFEIGFEIVELEPIEAAAA